MDSTQPPEPVPATPATRRCTLYAAIGGAATLALSLATFLTQPRRDEHYALPCLLLAIGALLLAAAFIACSRGTLALGELELGAKLLILGATALSIEIAIRLLAAKHFDGYISSFDFGTKSDGEGNRAFTHEFNSFGHCFQGSLSILLVPAVEAVLPEWTRIVSCLVAVYPIYNLIKRALDASAFAASSFSNNSAEWAMGFWLGLSLGVLVAARAPAPPKPEICRPRVAAGVLLCLVSLAAAVLYGVSWDNTGDRAKGEDGVDLAMLIVFLAVPLGLAATYAAYYALSACCGLCLLCALCDSFDPTFNPERWEERNNAAKRLRVARRRAGV
mmetsp:Transcript_24273/g.63281  ORF Transcript_24273/g.63281 Transcript_24273/m.63281 type:complete len:331 (+) Transcript_24273:220-1212(+)